MNEHPRLSHVALHNFKCWADETIPLGALTLLTGLNGAGKSSLIQSLMVLRQSHQQGLLAQGALAINGEIVTIGTGADAFCEQAGDKELHLGLAWTDNVERTWKFSYDRDSDVLARTGEEVTAPDRPPFFGEVAYLAAERLGPRVVGEVSEYRVRVRREVGSRGELAAHFLSVHGSTPIAIEALGHAAAVSTSLLHNVEAWLGEISPGARLHLAEQRGLDAVQVRFSFAGGHGGSNQYRATNVGFGLTYTLPIIVALLASRRGALLVVENPEAHLHPRGQVQLASLLARAAANGVQVLIETHSDHVLNGIRLAVHAGTLAPDQAAVHFFAREASAKDVRAVRVSPVIDADGRLTPWPAGFFDEIETSLAALLAPRPSR